jgi:hypothetical protein
MSAVSWQHYVTSLASLHNDWTNFISIKLETITSLINHNFMTDTGPAFCTPFNIPLLHLMYVFPV